MTSVETFKIFFMKEIETTMMSNLTSMPNLSLDEDKAVPNKRTRCRPAGNP